MKKIILLASAVFFLLTNAAIAAENENTGFYVGVKGAYVIPQTMTIYSDNGNNFSMDTKLKNGYLAGATVGWNTPFTNRILAVELEYNYIFGTDFDNGKTISVMGQNAGTLDGTIKIHALLLNLKARYPKGRFHPYTGFGVGWSYMQLGDITETAPDGSVSIAPGNSGNAFCYQLLAGLDFDITQNLGIGIGYKYFATKPTIGSTNSNTIYADADYKAHIVTLGLTYTF